MKTDCYSDIASVYHMIFEDWDSLVNEQSKILSFLLPQQTRGGIALDCSCGIGTQSLALALAGYLVEGLDISVKAIERAQEEAKKRNLSIDFRLDDMRELRTATLFHYDVVISFDNSIPHLDSNEEILKTLSEMKRRLKSGGVLLISLRDYEVLMQERPAISPPKFFQDGLHRRIFHQIWDWQDTRRYKVHFHFVFETNEGWNDFHSVGQYRAISIEELISFIKISGFENIQIFRPDESGFYQPIIRAFKP